MVDVVERTSGQSFDEFVGFARVVKPVVGNFGPQYEIEIEPEDKNLIKSGKTGRFHEYLRLSPKATETTVPENSVLDLYLKRVEAVVKEAKNVAAVMDALKLLLDKKILWRKEVLGRTYVDKKTKVTYEASEHWVPSRVM